MRFLFFAAVFAVFGMLIVAESTAGVVSFNSSPPSTNLLESFQSDSAKAWRTNRGNGQTRANSGQSFDHLAPYSVSAVTFRIWPNQSGGDVSFSGGSDVVELRITEDTTANGTPNLVNLLLNERRLGSGL